MSEVFLSHYYANQGVAREVAKATPNQIFYKKKNYKANSTSPTYSIHITH